MIQPTRLRPSEALPPSSPTSPDMSYFDRFDAPSHSRAPARRVSSLDAAMIQAVNLGLDGAVSEFLAQGANPNGTDEHGVPIIHLAFSAESDEASIEAIARMMRSAGANPRAPHGSAPSLPERVIRVFPGPMAERFLELIVELGFDIDARGPKGRTALMWEIEHARGGDRMVETLLRAGANPAAQDHEGVDAYALAQRNGRKDALVKMAVAQERGAIERVVSEAEAPSKKRGPL